MYSRDEKVAYVHGVANDIIFANNTRLEAQCAGPIIANCREIDAVADKIDRIATRTDFMSTLMKVIVGSLLECGGG